MGGRRPCKPRGKHVPHIWITGASLKPRVNDNRNSKDLSQWLAMHAMHDQMFAPLCFFTPEVPRKDLNFSLKFRFLFPPKCKGLWGQGDYLLCLQKLLQKALEKLDGESPRK